MSREELATILDVLKPVFDWPAETRLSLAIEILMSLEGDERMKHEAASGTATETAAPVVHTIPM